MMRSNMTPERLAEIKNLVMVATPLPWQYWEHQDINFPGEHLHGVSVNGGNCTHFFRPEDSRFVAASRSAVPELLAEVERLQAEVADLEDRLWTFGEAPAHGQS